MAIVKYRNQTGVLYAYNQTSVWDPVRKQSRSKREFLGRVDEETGEIIKSTGKRGRKPKEKDLDGEGKTSDYETLYREALARINALEKELETLSIYNEKLKAENMETRGKIHEIRRIIEE